MYLVFRDVLKTKKAKNRKENEQIVPLKHEIAFGELSSPRRASCNYWHVGLGGLKNARFTCENVSMKLQIRYISLQAQHLTAFQVATPNIKLLVRILQLAVIYPSLYIELHIN